VKLHWKSLRLAAFLVLALLAGGCAGINTTQSVSPLDFLLPGAGHFLQNTRPAPDWFGTNTLVAAATLSPAPLAP
jgi:hypothetical protein